jgi:hypothetical protein
MNRPTPNSGPLESQGYYCDPLPEVSRKVSFETRRDPPGPRVNMLKRNASDRRGSNHSSLVGFFSRSGSIGGKGLGRRKSVESVVAKSSIGSLGRPPSDLPPPPSSSNRW